MDKIRVLVVDDNTNFLQLAQLGLGPEKYEVFTSADGQDGFDQAKKVKPDVILLDVMMPHVSGLELLRMLLSDEDVRAIPVIVITASHFDSAMETVFKQEGNVKSFIQKPCPVNILRDKITEAVKKAD